MRHLNVRIRGDFVGFHYKLGEMGFQPVNPARRLICSEQENWSLLAVSQSVTK
jgi:hypothetical protein